MNKVVLMGRLTRNPDVKVSSQTVWVTGQLRFVVLYRSEDNRLESFTDSINFGEKIFMDEVEERDTVNLSGDLEDLNIRIIFNTTYNFFFHRHLTHGMNAKQSTHGKLSGIDGTDIQTEFTKEQGVYPDYAG